MSIIKNVKTVWSFRSLIGTFAITDLKLRYRNSILGFFWSFLEPLLLLGILYLIFTQVIKSQIENYPLFLLFGLITWNMFARGTMMGLSSILNRGGIFSKVSLPLEIPATSVSITSFIMMTFEFAIFFIFMIMFQFIPPIAILWLPLLLLLTLVLVIGISLPLSVMYVFYRDLGYMWGVILQAGFFLSPIIYDLSIFPEEIRSWFYYNPMAGILNIGHAIVLGREMPSTFEILYTIFIPFIILGIGYVIFRRYSVRVVEEL